MAYRRMQPEGTVLYEAVRENLATLLAEASDVGRGLPRYVERDARQVQGVRAQARGGGRAPPRGPRPASVRGGAQSGYRTPR